MHAATSCRAPLIVIARGRIVIGRTALGSLLRVIPSF
jgi:hypothetical protein